MGSASTVNMESGWGLAFENDDSSVSVLLVAQMTLVEQTIDN